MSGRRVIDPGGRRLPPALPPGDHRIPNAAPRLLAEVIAINRRGASALIYWIIPLGGDKKQDLIPQEGQPRKSFSFLLLLLFLFFSFFFFLIFFLFSEASLSLCRRREPPCTILCHRRGSTNLGLLLLSWRRFRTLSIHPHQSWVPEDRDFDSNSDATMVLSALINYDNDPGKRQVSVTAPTDRQETRVLQGGREMFILDIDVMLEYQ